MIKTIITAINGKSFNNMLREILQDLLKFLKPKSKKSKAFTSLPSYKLTKLFINP